MDPLSLSANIIGVLTLAGQLLAAGYFYGNSVRDFPNDLRDLVGELSSLSGILYALKAIMESPEYDSTTGTDSGSSTKLGPSAIARVIKIPLEECENLLADMVAALDKYQKPGSKTPKLVRSLTWPFKKDETRGWIEKLERYKSTFTLALSTDELFLMSTISSNLEGMRMAQITANQQKDMAEEKSRVSQFLDWVSPASAEKNYSSARKVQQSGTGRWFTKGKSFQNWLVHENSFLWLHGIPGSGKTILTTIIIDQILSEVDPTTTVAYFYFDFKESIKQTSRGFLGSIIAQLAQQRPQTLEILEKLYEDSDSGRRQPDAWGLDECLRNIIRRLPKIILVIDALDECVERAHMFRLVGGLRKMTNVSLLITSRADSDIKLEFMMSPNLLISKVDVSVDIECFVRGEIQRQPKLAQLKPEIQASITTTLVQGANGMFRWAKCCLDQIVKLRNDKAIKAALRSLPPTLEKTYERILCNIPEEDRLLALAVLRWLLFSRRPMALIEVVEGISVEIGAASLDPDNKLNEPEDIVDICGGLINIDDQSILGLAHFTVREYLISADISQGPAASYHTQHHSSHVQLAKICLTYTMFDAFSGGPCDDYEIQFAEYPLRPYAAQYWPEHVSECEDRTDETLDQLIMDFFHLGHDSGKFRSWRELYEFHSVITTSLSARTMNSSRDRLPKPPGAPIYFAASMGQYQAVRELLELGADVNSAGGRCAAPLYAATEGGHQKTVILLLENGADPNIERGKDKETPLAWAAENGQAGCVKSLLDFNADPTRGFGNIPSANLITTALWYGHGNVMEVVLEAKYFQDMGVPEVLDGTNLFTVAFVASAAQGFEKSFRTLLERIGKAVFDSATIEAVDSSRNCLIVALRLATLHGHARIIKAVLESDDLKIITTHDDIFRTLLEEAAYSGRDKIVDLLLGLNKSPGSQALGIALHLAAANGNSNVVERLLRAGASPTDKDDDGWCPVLYASEYRSHHVMEKLSRVVDVSKVLNMTVNAGPTAWDKVQQLGFSTDGLDIILSEDKNTRVYRSLNPIAPLSTNYSFETEIIDGSEMISIGFVDMTYGHCIDGKSLLKNIPGETQKSWGYKSSGDIAYGDDYIKSKSFPRYGPGDIVGCHFDMTKEVAFFTLNGQIIGSLIADIKGKIFPVVGTHQGAAHFRTNFGNSPFIYEVPVLSEKHLSEVCRPMISIDLHWCNPNV